MRRTYHQLTIEERCEMARLQGEGYSQRQIAASLDRSPSTVSRELRRNSSRTGGYKPTYANQQARARRWSGSKLDRDAGLRRQVLSCLMRGWSPEQVSGRLALEAGGRVISHETIYRFIYAQTTRTKNYSWRHYLPRAKSKRGRRRRGRRSPASFIRLRRALDQRPAEADDRATPGHWEADLMLFGNRGQSLLTLHERYSRLMLALPLTSKEAEPTAQALARMLEVVPAQWRRTVTFDNGTEFARHYQLHPLGLKTYFCNTRSSRQKGGVENGIGRLRRFLPRTTNMKELTWERVKTIIQAYNNTPRKCLNYRTPAEIYNNQVLHLKCVSSFPPSRERRWCNGIHSRE